MCSCWRKWFRYSRIKCENKIVESKAVNLSKVCRPAFVAFQAPRLNSTLLGLIRWKIKSLNAKSWRDIQLFFIGIRSAAEIHGSGKTALSHFAHLYSYPLKFGYIAINLTLCVVTFNISQPFSLKICVSTLLLCFAKRSWTSVCYIVRAETSCEITLIIYSNITLIWSLYVDTSLLYNTA